MGQLDNKIVVVTGAGRGIGKAISLAFATEGAKVCCVARTAQEIEVTLSQIENAGGKGMAIAADLTDPQAVEESFDKVYSECGGLDVLIANAGGLSDTEFVEHSDPELWKEILDANLVTSYLSIQAAIPLLKRRGGGKIVTMGSGMGHKGVPGNSAYACAKAGLWMLTRVLAEELLSDNISVNELIPGPVHTSTFPGNSATPAPNLQREWFKQPEDVVPMALFLATQPPIGPTAQSYSLMRRVN